MDGIALWVWAQGVPLLVPAGLAEIPGWRRVALPEESARRTLACEGVRQTQVSGLTLEPGSECAFVY